MMQMTSWMESQINLKMRHIQGQVPWQKVSLQLYLWTGQPAKAVESLQVLIWAPNGVLKKSKFSLIVSLLTTKYFLLLILFDEQPNIVNDIYFKLYIRFPKIRARVEHCARSPTRRRIFSPNGQAYCGFLWTSKYPLSDQLTRCTFSPHNILSIYLYYISTLFKYIIIILVAAIYLYPFLFSQVLFLSDF